MDIALMFVLPSEYLDAPYMRNGKMKMMVGNLNGALTGETTGAEFDVECVKKTGGSVFHVSYIVSDTSPRKCKAKAKKLVDIINSTIKPGKVYTDVYN